MNSIRYFFLKVLALLLVGTLGACGSDEIATPQNSPIEVKTVIAANASVLSESQLQTISSEMPGQLVFNGTPNVKVGDVLITQHTVLKVTGISALDENGKTAIVGVVPDLSDVFKSLEINVTGYNPTPDQFIPEDSSVTVVQDTSMQATVNKLLSRILPKSSSLLTSTTLKATLSQKVNSAVSGSLTISISPKLDYNVTSDSLSGPHGTIKFNSPISASPSVKIDGNILSFDKTFPLGKYRIPIIGPLAPPGMLYLTIPVNLKIKGAGGNISANFGVGATYDSEFTVTVQPASLSIDQTGKGFSFTADGNNITAFDVGVNSNLDARLQTGVSLSAFFGLAEPLYVLVSGGVLSDLTYLKLGASSSTNKPFDISCLSGKISGVAEITARASLFGLSASKQAFNFSTDLYIYAPAPGCTALEVTATPSRAYEGDTVTIKAKVPAAGALASAPTGTINIVDMNPAVTGMIGCYDVPLDATGSAECSGKVYAHGSIKTADIRADYSGDSNFPSGTGLASITILSPSATTTLLTADPKSVPAFGDIIFTAKVTGAGNNLLTETVDFIDQSGAILCSNVPLAAGIATCSKVIQSGPVTVSAYYSGDSGHDPSTGNVTIYNLTGTWDATAFSLTAPNKLITGYYNVTQSGAEEGSVVQFESFLSDGTHHTFSGTFVNKSFVLPWESSRTASNSTQSYIVYLHNLDTWTLVNDNTITMVLTGTCNASIPNTACSYNSFTFTLTRRNPV